jgi:hypothetical protein
LVIYFHGAGETANSLLSDPLKSAMVHMLLGRGYMLATSDAHWTNWGNDASVADCAHLYQSAKKYHAISSVVLLSQSMGGLDGLLTINRQTIPAKAWCGIYPVTNLQNMRYGDYRSQIESAYAGQPMSGNDPSILPSPKIPMLLFLSRDDRVVSAEANGLRYANLPNATIIMCRGDHGDSSHFQPSVVADFFNKSLGR